MGLIAPLVPLAGKAATWFGGTKLASAIGMGGKLAANTVARNSMFPQVALNGAVKGGQRMATQAMGEAAEKGILGKLGSSAFGQNFKAGLPATKGEFMGRAMPDLFFGGVAGLMTPGDLGDKLIAGTTATAGGALGSMGLRAGINAVRPGAVIPGAANYRGGVDMMSEIIGGFGGDVAANGVADGIMRIKGGGTTPWEKMAADQQQQMEQEILRKYLSGKGGYPTVDPTLASNGLA